MTWRTGTKNPHTLYYRDEPQGFFLHPYWAAKAAEALNGLTDLENRLNGTRGELGRAQRLIHGLLEDTDPSARTKAFDYLGEVAFGKSR